MVINFIVVYDVLYEKYQIKNVKINNANQMGISYKISFNNVIKILQIKPKKNGLTI